MQKFIDEIAPYAKAVAGAAVAGLTYLIGVIPASGGFGDVTVAGWMGFAIAILASFGVVYQIPNR